MITRKILVLILLLLQIPVPGADSEPVVPWEGDFQPTRQLWVAPAGTGDGSRDDPAGLAQMASWARPGDLIWFLPGTYPAGKALLMTQNGTAEAPIVYRACPNAHVILDGGVGYLSQYTWLWGFDMTNITDPGDGPAVVDTPEGPVKGGAALANVKVAGGRLINNIIHDAMSSQSGIGGWDGGSGQIFYGNIIYGNGQDPDTSRAPHGIYTQNHYDLDGYKYYVNNMVLDHAQLCGEKCYNFHAHTQGAGYVSGMVVIANIFSGGRFAIGGANSHHSPADHNFVTGNYFYDMGEIQLGFRKPWQGWFTDNYVAGNSGVLLTIWGDNEESFTRPGPTIVRHNTFIYTDNLHHLDLYAMTSATPIGQAPLWPGDIIDNNYYGEGIKVRYWVNGQALSLKSLAEWQNQPLEDGRTTPFDQQSTVGPNPTTNAVFILPNEYEPGRAHLAIYNWAGQETTLVDFGDVLQPGREYLLKSPKDFYGQPIMRFVYDGQPLSLPTPATFQAYVVMPAVPDNSNACEGVELPGRVLPFVLLPSLFLAAALLIGVVKQRGK